MQHGCYLNSTDGIRWSCSINYENWVKGIRMKKGDVLTITYLPNQRMVEFSCLGVKISLSINLNNELYGVVILGATDDCVEISNFKYYD